MLEKAIYSMTIEFKFSSSVYIYKYSVMYMYECVVKFKKYYFGGLKL